MPSSKSHRVLAMPALFAVLGLTVGSVVVTAAPGNPAAAAERTPSETPSITWGECPEQPPGKSAGGKLECGTLPVPLDYQKPDGTTIEIAVSRIRSEQPAQRRGVLLFNPGGPGQSGLTTPQDMVASGLPADVQQSYDLIGFDPRGVGASAPVSCGLSPDQITSVFSRYADGPDDVVRQAGIAEDIADQCFAKEGDVLPYMTTRNTARDMDRIRTALGEDTISYVGISYGTYLGTVYAEMFPRHADRFVLDSAISPRDVWHDTFRSWGVGMEIRFPDFARWAAKRHESYEFGQTAREVRKTYHEIADQLDTTPAAGMDGTEFRQATRAMLYSDTAFPQLAQLWQGILRENPDMVGEVRTQAGLPTLNENFFSATMAVQCGDVAWPRSVETYQADVARDGKRYPLIGAMSANITPCARWPFPPKEQPTTITDHGQRNILIMQNLRDPATIYPGGVDLRHVLGDRARLVTVDHGGHGAYLTGNSCADDHATRYLADGEMPDGDPFCARDTAGGSVSPTTSGTP